MSYVLKQTHELLRDLWGHRGILIGNVSNNYDNLMSVDNMNYMTTGDKPGRVDDLDSTFSVHYINVGRSLNWHGKSNDINSKITTYSSESSRNTKIFLPKSIVKKSLESINVVSGNTTTMPLMILDPLRVKNLTYRVKAAQDHYITKDVTNMQDVVSFEDMCLEKAHLYKDIIAVTKKYNAEYQDKKYNRISKCIKEFYSITRSLTRMYNMHNVKFRDYSVIDIHTEKLALSTSYTDHLASLFNTQRHVYDVAHGNAYDFAASPLRHTHHGDFDCPDYDVNAMKTAHSALCGDKYSAHDKPFNFHRAVTQDYDILINSILPEDSKSKPDLVLRGCNVEYDNDTYIITRILDPGITTLRTESESNTYNYSTLGTYLLGNTITLNSDLTNATITLPGLPTHVYDISMSDLDKGLVTAIAARKHDKTLTDLEFIDLLIESGLHVYRSNDNGLEILSLYAMLLGVARLSPSIATFNDWLNAMDTTLSNYILNLRGANIDIPVNLKLDANNHEINLQALFIALAESDKFLKIMLTPSVEFLVKHIIVRYTRRLLAFIYKTLRKNKEEYANNKNLRIKLWNVLANILHSTVLRHFTPIGCASLLLHTKYTMHSMLPTQVEDVVIRCSSLYSHLTLMRNLNIYQYNIENQNSSNAYNLYVDYRSRRIRDPYSIITMNDLEAVLNPLVETTMQDQYNKNRNTILGRRTTT